MSSISLLTDFGVIDEYAGVMKGIILSIHPAAVIVDITHQIDPQDIVQAAFTIKSAYRYFPKRSVHLIVVDPGVGGERDIIAIQSRDHIFVAPDNGVLTLILEGHKPDFVIRVNNPSYFRQSISPTFHGRDIFAPVGAYLAKGVNPNYMGPEIDLKSVFRLPNLGCEITQEGVLVGKVISIDRFGNLITNIGSEDLDAYVKAAGDPSRIQIYVGKNSITGLVKTYEKKAHQQPLVLIGSRAYLEIAVNRGSAKEQLNVNKGDPVQVMI